jgi:hypothetical protein
VHHGQRRAGIHGASCNLFSTDLDGAFGKAASDMWRHRPSSARPLSIWRNHQYFTQWKDRLYGSPQTIRLETIVIGYQNEWAFH